VLDEQQLAARPQYAPHLGERGAGLRDRAQGPGRDDRINAVFVERTGMLAPPEALRAISTSRDAGSSASTSRTGGR
jgi:hypothetical protein